MRFVRVPNGGIQPEVARDPAGVLHMIYYSGEPGAGNLFYVRSRDDGRTFTSPVRVNSQDGSAVGAGMIRGGQIAVGRGGRVHVAWNGSGTSLPKGSVDVRSGKPGPAMLYSRSNDAGTAFEPQRSVMLRSVTLDGGGSVAADLSGNVYVAWHGNDVKTGNDGEENRRVFLARSSDDGVHFAPDAPVSPEPTGACGCCGVRMLATSRGLLVLYRTATAKTSRDMYLMRSDDGARTFTGARVHPWQIAACPMTSMTFTEARGATFAGWETDGQVFFGSLDPQRPVVGGIRSPSGQQRPRKHPRLAADRSGRLLIVWTERTSSAREGNVGWQIFGTDGQPTDADSRQAGLPPLSYAAPISNADGTFTVFY